jgi:hypothetical protein
MRKKLFLLPITFCTNCLYKISDLFISAMRMCALNWLKIGRRAADAGVDVAQSGKKHVSELRAQAGKLPQDTKQK